MLSANLSHRFGSDLLNAADAGKSGYRHLAAWLRDVETKWRVGNGMSEDDQTASLIKHIDYMRKLSSQADEFAIRVLYTASGTRLSATRITSVETLVYHGAYWAAARSFDEASYLIALINSAAVLAKITDLQPHGQRDKRHFDNLVWTLPIPEYDETDQVHQDLAAAAVRAEAVAAATDLTSARHFTSRRRAIREALLLDGVARDIELLVDAILPP